MAGAVLLPLSSATGQVRDTIPRRPRDSTTIIVPGKKDTLADSLLTRADSLKRNAPKDSIKAPLAKAENPIDIGIARRLHWVRDSLYGRGAITVADLLENLQGVTTLRAGWISSPMVASYMGHVRHVRVFWDGLEMGALDPRAHSELDLQQINLWSIEEADIEQAPEEIRVYLRSWRVDNTTPVTRTDVSTGDQQTNLYRGFFGKRPDNGMAFQFGAQQFGTTPPSSLGSSSDQLGLTGRIGWAKRDWSWDAYTTRTSRHRGTIIGFTLGDSIRAVESARSYSYLRGAYGDPDTSHVWTQVMAIASSYGYTGVRTVPTTSLTTAAESALAVTSLDTSAYQTQYLAAAGVTRGPLRASLTQRLFLAGGHHIASAAWRASYTTSLVDVTGFWQGKSADSIEHLDVSARLTPLSFVSVLAGVGKATQHGIRDSTVAGTSMRAEAGLRFHNLWFIGGVLRRDSVSLDAPAIFDSTFVRRAEPAANAVTAAIRGQLWRLLNVDLSAVKWSDTLGYYRPKYQTRSELFVQTSLLDRFPSGHFGIKASLVHEYRSNTRFPVGKTDVITMTGYRTISSLVEIRIIDATLSWQFRNMLGERYMQVPSFLMPRQTNFYGVRWNFVN